MRIEPDPFSIAKTTEIGGNEAVIPVAACRAFDLDPVRAVGDAACFRKSPHRGLHRARRDQSRWGRSILHQGHLHRHDRSHVGGLEGRRRQVEERRESLREAIARASSSFDRYTKQLHQLGLESSEREVKWLNDLIAAERNTQTRTDQP